MKGQSSSAGLRRTAGRQRKTDRSKFQPVRTYERRARYRLRRFQKHSLVAVSMVALLLLTLAPAETPLVADDVRAQTAVQEQQAGDINQAPAGSDVTENTSSPLLDPGASAEQATGTVRELFAQAYAMWPKIAIALLIMLAAWGLARLIKGILRKILRNWNKAEAMGTFAGVAILLLALGTALSVIAGDVRALVGSVGLVGLALSWALQNPIESFTAWLLNSFKGYYHVGDRIAVGEVFGDVFKIDILTTTVWESGRPDLPVQGAQPTGALVTFPNSEVLRNNIINYTRDFPYVWDEITISIANESDFGYALQVIKKTAMEVVGKAMSKAAEEYRALLKQRRLPFDVALEPEVYASPTDSWTNFTIRYLVPVRERRHWASTLFLAISEDIVRPRHTDRILPASPRLQVDVHKS